MNKGDISIVEFAEKVVGLKLYPFQKKFLEKLGKKSDFKLGYIPRYGMFLIEENDNG